MNIDQKSRAGGELLTTSWWVLRSQPRLAILPLMTMALIVAYPQAVGPEGWRQMFSAGARYLILHAVTAFLDVAFCHEVLRILSGERTVNFERGIRQAVRRWDAVLLWTLLAGLASYALHAGGDRLGWLGRFSGALLELGWSTVILLSTPVLVRREGPNPFGVLRESVRLWRKVLGESVSGMVGILIFAAVASLIGLLFCLLISVITRTAGLDASWAVAILIMFAGGIVGLVVSISTIYCCAVYIYASEGVVPEPDANQLMDAAWKVKGSAEWKA